MKPNFLFIACLLSCPFELAAQAKNVILFIGDGAGVSSLNAAGIFANGRPQSLYLQSMPHLALVDTSTAREWVTDAAACASAYATGKKGKNGVMSMAPDAERDVKDGEIFKTVMEYAMENGLSTGVISNESVAGAAVSSFYAHSNNRSKAGMIFQQALRPTFGHGPDVIIGGGRKQIAAETAKLGRDLDADIKAAGYDSVDSLAALRSLDPARSRVMLLTDDNQLDFPEAVKQTVARLSRNPKGFLLVAHSDCHTGKSRTSIQRLVELDQAVAATTEQVKQNTLVLFTADHSYDLRIKGEHLSETSRSADHKNILLAVSLEDEHTAEEVPLLGAGPGSEQVHGFLPNTDVFHIMMRAFGWEKPAGERDTAAMK